MSMRVHAQELPWAGSDEGGFQWCLSDPIKMVRWLAGRCDHLAKALFSMASNTCHIILYLDEIVPGNMLAPDNKRAARS